MFRFSLVERWRGKGGSLENRNRRVGKKREKYRLLMMKSETQGDTICKMRYYKEKQNESQKVNSSIITIFFLFF